MRFFPRIYFVDDMPNTVMEKYHFNLDIESCLTGYICYITNNIYVLNGSENNRIALHEICHWFIQMFLPSGLHKFLDKYFSIKQKWNENMYRQMRTRKEKI